MIDNFRAIPWAGFLDVTSNKDVVVVHLDSAITNAMSNKIEAPLD